MSNRRMRQALTVCFLEPHTSAADIACQCGYVDAGVFQSVDDQAASIKT